MKFQLTSKEIFLHAVTGLLALVCLAVVSVFWKAPALLLFVLAAIAASMIFIGEERKRDLVLFLLVSVWGAFSEAIAIHYGAWSYPEPSIIGIPLWLPFVWGIAGIFIKRLYQAIREFI